MSSIYKNAKVINGLYFGPPKYVINNVDFSDILGRELEIKEGDRLDIIASQIYSEDDAWKYILIYNNIGDFFDVRPGVIIKLPYDLEKIKRRI